MNKQNIIDKSNGLYLNMPKVQKDVVKTDMKIRTNCPKEMLITVYSGMCNRMFLIISAMRICEKTMHRLTVFWSERTGRYGLPYYGDLNSDWDDYFERVDNISTYGIQGPIKFQDNYIALDQERTFPENLPIVNGHPYANKEMTLFMFGPKTVDVSHNKIIVQKLTKPFGTSTDNMKKYLNYIDKIGLHKKDEYLEELSFHAKKFKLISHLDKIFQTELEKFKKYDVVWGIHLRGTDLAPQTSKDKKAALMQIFQEGSDQIGYFIASDEAVPSWIAEKSNVISYNEPLKLENSVEGTQYALVDLFLLSKCNRIFGTSGSSFSMMSWMLSDLQEYTIHS
jgi:hypothetical protein